MLGDISAKSLQKVLPKRLPALLVAKNQLYGI